MIRKLSFRGHATSRAQSTAGKGKGQAARKTLVKTPASLRTSFSAACKNLSYQLRPFKAQKFPEFRLVMLALPLGVGPLEVFYAVFLEVPESGGNFVDQVVVVSY